MKISDFIKKNDLSNQHKVLCDSYKQIETVWNNEIDLSSIDKNSIKSVVITGLGGSALLALASLWPAIAGRR